MAIKQTLIINDLQRSVLVQGLNAIGWGALPANHPERKAAEALLKELAAK